MSDSISNADLQRALVTLLVERRVLQADRTILCQTMFCAGERCHVVYARGEAQRELGDLFHRELGRNLNRDKGEWLLDAKEAGALLTLAGIAPETNPKTVALPRLIWNHRNISLLRH
jgi:hypothetical protein